MKLAVNKTRKLWWGLSSALIIISIISMVISTFNPQIKAPLRPGLDFIGGTRLQLERDCTVPGNCDKPIDINVVRDIARARGLGDASIQLVTDKQTRQENGISIRSKDLSADQRTQLENALSEKIGAFDPQKKSIDTVGPTLGRELFTSGLTALFLSLVGILVYLRFRFQWDYAVFAIIALFHDVFITVGIFSILGFFGIEVDSLFVVALLTIVGFSVNDTVVIYDRIRETAQVEAGRPITEIIDDAVDQTLARSINTTFTTLLTLFAIFLFGGETLKIFSLSLIVGFTLGAYSSIFIASTLLAWWRQRSERSGIPPHNTESVAS
ncbi:protein-export membrane protein SecF [Calothrix sp. NIES-4071]|nr:protein-export membrane protein SecF [Calothrix sp. NIES-4071]BAZ60566.1 protein-export membrane protein SecF [Calothrix sp. NIES-4105]